MDSKVKGIYYVNKNFQRDFKLKFGSQTISDVFPLSAAFSHYINFSSSNISNHTFKIRTVDNRDLIYKIYKRNDNYTEAYQKYSVENQFQNQVNIIEHIAHKNCFMFIYEYHESNLYDLLTTQSPTEDQLIYYMYRISNAITSLHQKKILHRNINPFSILINHSKSFLLPSPYFKKMTAIKTHTYGTSLIEYCAPEMNEDEMSYGLEVDVWAFGIVLFLCFAPKNMWFLSRVGDDLKQRGLLLSQKAASKELTNNPDINNILARCIVIDPNERAKSEEISYLLSQIVKQSEVDDPEGPISLTQFSECSLFDDNDLMDDAREDVSDYDF